MAKAPVGSVSAARGGLRCHCLRRRWRFPGRDPGSRAARYLQEPRPHAVDLVEQLVTLVPDGFGLSVQLPHSCLRLFARGRDLFLELLDALRRLRPRAGERLLRLRV
jgi:hypothetical protein